MSRTDRGKDRSNTKKCDMGQQTIIQAAVQLSGGKNEEFSNRSMSHAHDIPGWLRPNNNPSSTLSGESHSWLLKGLLIMG